MATMMVLMVDTTLYEYICKENHTRIPHSRQHYLSDQHTPRFWMSDSFSTQGVTRFMQHNGSPCQQATSSFNDLSLQIQVMCPCFPKISFIAASFHKVSSHSTTMHSIRHARSSKASMCGVVIMMDIRHNPGHQVIKNATSHCNLSAHTPKS
ncbi:predicted protein [Lichtheimia corymbifera JMRC:FSU:9682]|uniref:Uncharacterized protein n=1 Tax=Lichtheimia corymbifera JMRC:FSU:9682 TaxID=1263082 RepID=A0A068RKU4_9FUNG|nr:predicted protein [Lichtheimia corymbifera JMRC:FSU:9682]